MLRKKETYIPVGVLSNSSKEVILKLVDQIPLPYHAEYIPLDQLKLPSEGSKLGSLSDLRVLIVDALDQDIKVFRLAYLIKRTYPQVRLVALSDQKSSKFDQRSHFDGHITPETFRDGIGPLLFELETGRESLFSKVLKSIKR